MPEEDGGSEMTDAVLEAQSHGLGGWRTALGNYRDLLGLDNGLVWLINIATLAIGYAVIDQTSGAAGLIIGGLLLATGAIGILDSLLGRVRG